MSWTLPGRADRSPTVLLAELPPGQLDSHPHDHHVSSGAIPSQQGAFRAQGIRPQPLVYPDSDTSNHIVRSRRADNHYYVDALTFCSTTTAVGTRPSASSVAASSR